MKERTELIIQIVNENPGIRYSELMRETGLKNGVLSHHLSKIEEAGRIVIERSPRVARLYPCGMSDEETIIIKNLHSYTSRQILLGLVERDMTFKEIVEYAKKSQGTVSIFLKNLGADQVVTRKLQNGTVIFTLTNRKLVSQLIEKYKPKLIESAADNMSDIMSSL
ncbi:MAG: ArsR family transcriptional regulator [Nitrososphaera sp.]|jgi:predicted transcriptional regulator